MNNIDHKRKVRAPADLRANPPSEQNDAMLRYPAVGRLKQTPCQFLPGLRRYRSRYFATPLSFIIMNPERNGVSRSRQLIVIAARCPMDSKHCVPDFHYGSGLIFWARSTVCAKFLFFFCTPLMDDESHENCRIKYSRTRTNLFGGVSAGSGV